MSTILPNTAGIVYSPYNWDVTASRARTITPGAYLRMTVDGNPATLTANFNTANVADRSIKVGIRVDGVAWSEHVLNTASDIPITLPADNTWGTRVVEIVFLTQSLTVERWAFPGECALEFTGITGDTQISTRITRRRKLNGIAVGDSITQGVRNKNDTLWPSYLNDDVRLGWAYPLADLLGCEIGVIGYAGVGLSRSGSGGVPKFPESVPQLWNGQPRDYRTPAEPDFIAAHLGTNDASASDSAVTADTAALMNHFLASTEKTPIIVFPGWMQRKAAAIRAGIAASTAPGRIHYVDTTGWWDPADAPDGLHPYGYVHLTDLAPRAADAISTFLKGNTLPATVFRCDELGRAVPISAIAF